MSFTFTTSRFPLCSCLCALAALVLLAIPGAAQDAARLTTLSLTTDAGGTVTLDPDPFAPATTSYTATVPYSVVYVEVAGTATSPDEVHPQGTDSESKQGHQIALNRGSTTTIRVEARATGKTTTTYTVTVTSSPASTDAILTNLTLSAGTLIQSDGTTQGFASAERQYTATVPRATSTITVTPTLPAGASVSYNPADTTPNTEGLQTPLKDGKNTITVTVTAEDGRTKETYTITVTRPGPDFDDATLSALRLSHGTLKQAAPGDPTKGFDPDVSGYTASVANGVRNLTVFATPTASGATARIGTDAIPSGGLIVVLSNVGNTPNTITVTVTAEEGTTTGAYTIAVTRADVPDKDASLGSLSLSPGTLSPAFNPATAAYTAFVPHATAIITVFATPSASGATVAYTLATTPSHRFQPEHEWASGPPQCRGKRHHRSGHFQRRKHPRDGTYTITVTRGAAPATDRTLRSLSLSAGTLSTRPLTQLKQATLRWCTMR